MSRGPGKVQRAILAKCEDGQAWSLDFLCGRIYRTPGPASRLEKSAVGRAIARMTLPGTWVFGRVAGDGPGGGQWWLYDPCNRASVERAFAESRYWGVHTGSGYDREVANTVARAVRWRDASPAERLDFEIEGAEMSISLAKARGDEELLREREDRLAELLRRKAALA
jgi:hypothetical protein